MFQHILVPLDGSPCSERALPVAAHIARATHGRLVLAMALPVPIEVAWSAMGSQPLMEDALDLELEETERYLARVCNSSALAGIATTTRILRIPGTFYPGRLPCRANRSYRHVQPR